jgi:raffinose/stachyose/melibiose transport system substrate-binding protein
MSTVTAAALITACSSSGGGSGNTGNNGNTGSTGAPGTSPSNKPVTLTWWHNGNMEPRRSSLQKVANDYHAAHPNVSFKINAMQNEQFKTKIPLVLQSGNPPDIYQQWGGGALITQTQSGKVMDITQASQSWIGELGPGAKGWQLNGKQYGVPIDYHIVGFWYRTDLFQRAGITSPPATMDDLNADVAKLKAAGITPIAIGSKDQWPDAFYWEYFVLRECPQATVAQAMQNQKLDDPCFVKAGQDTQAFLDTKPFQDAFLATAAQQGAGSSAGLVANGKAAMELQGDWEVPQVMPSLTKDKAFASKMGFFPFPSVSGGAGDQQAGLGGGDGFSCTTKATSACPDFLKYLVSAPVQRELVQTGASTFPVNPAANDAVAGTTMKAAQDYLLKVSYNQLYFDQALSTNVGLALDQAVADFFAGKSSPEKVAQSVAKAAARQ